MGRNATKINVGEIEKKVKKWSAVVGNWNTSREKTEKVWEKVSMDLKPLCEGLKTHVSVFWYIDFEKVTRVANIAKG